MSDVSAILNLPYIQPAQAQKHLTHNEAISLLDQIVQLAVLADDLATPPAAPATGARYIVASGGVGDWSGQDGQIAHFDGTLWRFTQPQAGYIAHVGARNDIVAYDGAAWQALAGAALDTVPELGIGTVADPNNVLSVKGDSTLFSHDGAGHRIVVNKDTAADTASLLFQTGWSGRAEMGTAGTDGFAIKTSADGVTWTTALEADAATGVLTIQPELKFTVKTYAQLTDPAVAGAGTLAFISDGPFGHELIMSDGIKWRLTRNNAIVPVP